MPLVSFISTVSAAIAENNTGLTWGSANSSATLSEKWQRRRTKLAVGLHPPATLKRVGDVSIGADDATGIDYSNQALHCGIHIANAEQLRCDTRQVPGWLPRPRRSQGESIAKSSPHR
ncbi:hypothetical protein ACQP2T_56010 [Nonomuraea sp. CA-143628]|uniref:hypothetical protein n=1 Tax=Nonomuraea sp. CA-143628 TaxID=3239997 RepID=UPI003D909CEB